MVLFLVEVKGLFRAVSPSAEAVELLPLLLPDLVGVLVLGLVPLVEEAQAADLTTKSLALRRRRGRP